MGSDDTLSQVRDGRAWDDFCDRLKEAGRIVLRPETPATEIDRAEALRYLARLTRMGLEVYFEHTDVDFPVLYNAPRADAKAGADNPDNHYLTATISGHREYRIRGVRGTVPIISFSTKADRSAKGGRLDSTGGLDARDLVVSADGSFEVAVSREPRPGNWLPIAEDTTLLVVKQTFLDRSSETPAEVTLEQVGGRATPRPLTAKRASWALRGATSLVSRIATRYADWAQWFQAKPNTLQSIEGTPLQEEGADPNICYLFGYWSIGPEEALVVESPVPECEAWNFQLNNYWLESLEYRYHRIHVNKHSARYNDDGSVTIVVAHEDLGVGNYLDTAGHRCGTMALRWTRAVTHPVPTCRVVKLLDLRTLSE